MNSRRRSVRGRSPRLVPDAAGRVLFGVLLPLWALPGLVDWWFHRRSDIQEPKNGGVRESLLHLVMLGEGAPSLGLALWAEINPLVLTLMAGGAILHEATVTRDLAVASESDRQVTPGEQQVHSFLETIPFLLVLLSALHAQPGIRDLPADPRWALRSKAQPLPRRYVAGVVLLGTLLGALPHTEELIRCIRTASSPPSSRQGGDR